MPRATIIVRGAAGKSVEARTASCFMPSSQLPHPVRKASTAPPAVRSIDFAALSRDDEGTGTCLGSRFAGCARFCGGSFGWRDFFCRLFPPGRRFCGGFFLVFSPTLGGGAPPGLVCRSFAFEIRLTARALCPDSMLLAHEGVAIGRKRLGCNLQSR